MTEFDQPNPEASPNQEETYIDKFESIVARLGNDNPPTPAEYIDFLNSQLHVDGSFDVLKANYDPEIFYEVMIKAIDYNSRRSKYLESLEINWEALDSPDEHENIKFEFEDDSISQSIDDLKLQATADTAKEVAQILGFLEQDYYQDIPIWNTKLRVTEPSEIGNARAAVNIESVKFSKDFFDDDNLLESQAEKILEILNVSSIEEADSSDIDILLRAIRQAAVAHELYHLRQKMTLYPRLSKSKRYKVEKGEITKYLDTQYAFEPDERAARAFEIRYLREKAKHLDDDSREKNLLISLIEQKTTKEENINQYYTERVAEDKKYRDMIRYEIKKGLEEIRQKATIEDSN